jgi:hypothetical protein
VGSDEERDETLSSVIAWLENDPVTTVRENEDRDGSVIEPATTDTGAHRDEAGVLSDDLEAQEVELKRRIDFTLHMTTMDEVDWMYGVASCPPWGKPWRRCHAFGEWEGIPRDRYWPPLDRDL